jgi:hypothetical protein
LSGYCLDLEAFARESRGKGPFAVA